MIICFECVQIYCMANNYQKIMSGLFSSSESKMTLDDFIKSLENLKAKGVPGNATVSLIAELDGSFGEFGALGSVNIHISDTGSQLLINLKR